MTARGKTCLKQFSTFLFTTFIVQGSLLHAEPTRDDAIRTAYRNNPELSVASLEIERAAARLQWSGRLSNPELEFSYRGDGFGNDERESVTEVGFTQAFPLTAKLKHEKELRSTQVILAEAEIAEKRRQLAGQVDLALIDLIATRERIAVARKLVELNEEIVEFLKEQARQGLVSSLDVMQATLSGRTLEQRARNLAAMEKQNLLQLNKVMGLAPESPIEVEHRFRIPGSPPKIEVSFHTVLQQRPDYVLAVSRTDEAAAAVTLEQAKRWQDVSVGLFVEQERAVDDPTGLDGNTFTGFGVSIPLPFRDRNEEKIALAEIDQKAAQKSVEAIRFRIRSECEEAFQLRKDQWTLAHDASGELLQLAKTNLEEFQKAYQQGQASLLQVQRAQEQVLELQTASLEFLTEYARAEAAVRLATGSYPRLSVTSEKNPQ